MNNGIVSGWLKKKNSRFMKHIFSWQSIAAFLVGVVLCSASCTKPGTCTAKLPVDTAPQNEQQRVFTYLNSRGISAILHPNGFYYVISNAGTGNKINPCNIITMQYTGQLEDGKIFDETASGSAFRDRASVLIPGLQQALSLVGRGAQLQVYLPPALAFGYVHVGDPLNPSIPANSIVVFSINIIAVE